MVFDFVEPFTEVPKYKALVKTNSAGAEFGKERKIDLCTVLLPGQDLNL